MLIRVVKCHLSYHTLRQFQRRRCKPPEGRWLTRLHRLLGQSGSCRHRERMWWLTNLKENSLRNDQNLQEELLYFRWTILIIVANLFPETISTTTSSFQTILIVQKLTKFLINISLSSTLAILGNGVFAWEGFGLPYQLGTLVWFLAVSGVILFIYTIRDTINFRGQ